MSSESPITRNRAAWNKSSEEYQSLHSEQLSKDPMAWGVWAVPEQTLGVLGDVSGKDILEFGCGGAQWSIALARLGARAVGIDLSEGQLAHARGAGWPWVWVLESSWDSRPLRSAQYRPPVGDLGPASTTGRVRNRSIFGPIAVS